MSITDLKGNVLVGVGWQDICTKFHRVHPETCKNCIESDIELSAGVFEGEYKLYKCKNNMWDVSTPIMVGAGIWETFFLVILFDDEQIDYELFRLRRQNTVLRKENIFWRWKTFSA
jgi:ligand-binding sensor protein